MEAYRLPPTSIIGRRRNTCPHLPGLDLFAKKSLSWSAKVVPKAVVTTLEDECAWLSSYHLNSGFVENVGAGLEICAAARLISTQQCLCTLCLTISIPTPLRAQLHAVIKTLWNTMREQAMQAYRRAIARAASAVATPFFRGNLWNLDHEVHYRLVLAMAGVELTDQEQ